MKKYISPLLIICAALMTGCASVPPQKVPLALESNHLNKPIKVFSLVEQDEINAVVPIVNSSGATAQFGLIGLMIGGAIDASTNKSAANRAEKNLSPIRDHLIHFDFRAMIEKQLSQQLLNSDVLNVSQVISIKSADEIQNHVRDGEAYMLVSSNYTLSADFRVPFVNSRVSLDANAPDKSKPNILYKNTLTFYGKQVPAVVKTQQDIDAKISELEENYNNLSVKERRKTKYDHKKSLKDARTPYNQDDKIAIATKTWAENNTYDLKNELSAGIAFVATQLTTDIKDTTAHTIYESQASTIQGYPSSRKSILVGETDSRIILRLTSSHNSGALCSEPKFSLLCI